MESEKFWTEDPCVLIHNIRLIPTDNMSKDEKLNAITRVALLVSFWLYFINYEHWLIFMLCFLLLIVIFRQANKKNKEKFTIVPTYSSTDMHTTTLAPLFAEEWQIYPPAYDLYVNGQPTPEMTFEEPLHPQSYPYGQYLTKTNLLPSDEYGTHMLNGGPRQAREYINGSFLRHELGFRENMSRLYKLKLNRRFRHNCNDTFSPFESY